MTTLDKVRWVLGLGVVFLLILISGRSNVDSSKSIQAAMETLYEDHLLVKGHIFDLASILHDKELAMVMGDEKYFAERRGPENKRALELMEDFSGARLVPTEAATLKRFASTFAAMTQIEGDLSFEPGARPQGEAAERMAEQINSLQADLLVLSRIQLDEGRRQLNKGDKAVERMDLFASIEAYFLAAIGALMVGVVLFIPKRASA